MKARLLSVFFWVLAVHITAQVHDLSISRWLLPQTAGDLGTTETIRFEIENLGSSDETGFMVAFSMNGGQSFTEEVYSGTVPAGAKRTQTFTATGNFAVDGATYNVIGKVILAGDEVPGNDEVEVAIINKIPGDMCDEPIVSNLEYYVPFEDSRDMAFFSNDYGYHASWGAPNYLSDKEVLYSFQSTAAYSCVDVAVHSNWAGNFNPGIAIHVISACPEGSFFTVSRGSAIGTLDASFTDGFLFAAQTYYLVVSQRYSYDATYDLTVNLYQQTDFKSFGFQSLETSAEINYVNHTIVITVPHGTNVSNLTPEFVTSFYADAYVDDVMQTSGIGTVDFTNAMTYAVTQNINPFGSQDWMISVEEGVPNTVVLAENAEITMSPNPVISDMLVQLPFSSVLFNRVTVVNGIGTIVHTQSTGSSRTITLPLGHLSPGIYFVVIEMDGRQVVKKFMKR